MLKLRQLQKQKQQENSAKSGSSSTESRVSSSQIRLQKDITELDLPKSIKITFPDPSNISEFEILIAPQQGYYKNGKFRFSVSVSEDFPIDPPKIKCLKKIYHPNIDTNGNICLNILREDWSPVLNLNSVIIGLNFLFLEPNPNDPLNKDAANVLSKNSSMFAQNVISSMRGGYVDDQYYDYVLD